MSSNPSTTSTLEEFIKAKPADELNHYNLSILGYLNGVEFPIDELINDYIDLFEEKVQLVKLSTDEYYNYIYNPQKLSYDIYGSECFDYLILRINNILQEYEFDKQIIRLISFGTLINILSKIYSAETNYLTINRRKIREAEKEAE